MNFFEQQDIARRNARLLLWSFAAAVVLLVLLTNAALAGFLWFNENYNVYSGSRGGWQTYFDYFTVQRFGWISLGMVTTIGLVAVFNWLRLATGGKAVAEGMGGRRVLPQTDSREEQRCLNVVEEMALAATMPVPALYVMDDERGINAFAAGITPADAVIAVTRGTIHQLQRHELEGVIAHEFSHILNGDMRLNIRLAAMLKGITFLSDAGYVLMHSRSRGYRMSGGSGNNGQALVPLMGLALWLFGWVGGLAASCIKAAIGRQKEYLADASAVQFTRNPDTIGDALKVIGGYVPGTLVHAARASEMSHIFFGQIRHSLWDTFATHPPLDERIKRVDPRWNGNYIKRREQNPATSAAAEVGVNRAAIVMAAMASSTIAAAADANFSDRTPVNGIPGILLSNSHEPLGATAISFALLLSPLESIRSRQLGAIESTGVAGLASLTATLQQELAALAQGQRLPLLERCLPALKSISAQQYRLFKDTLIVLIQADREIELHEWCLYQVIRHYLDPEFVRVKPSKPRYSKLAKVQLAVRQVLSVLAYEGSGEPQAVFRQAADQLGFKSLALMPSDHCSVQAFSAAVNQLADCYPLLKPRLLKAMATSAGADGQLTGTEHEIIASMAAVMDCPLPAL
jgi:Zn-dependent protease with chaperone function